MRSRATLARIESPPYDLHLCVAKGGGGYRSPYPSCWQSLRFVGSCSNTILIWRVCTTDVSSY
jgi:hypothetical protein